LADSGSVRSVGGHCPFDDPSMPYGL